MIRCNPEVRFALLINSVRRTKAVCEQSKRILLQSWRRDFVKWQNPDNAVISTIYIFILG